MLFVPLLVKYLKTPPGDSKNRANSRNFIWPPGGGDLKVPLKKEMVEKLNCKIDQI